MKESTTKKLLNYTTGLTKVTEKKLSDTKSKESKIEIISKQFEEIKKKVHEIVESESPLKTEGVSEIQLKFNKLENKIDIIEASQIAQESFLTELLKTGELTSNGSKDSEDGDSLIDQIKTAFGFDGDGKLELNEIISLFSEGGMAVSGITSALGVLKGIGSTIGSVVTNPYIMIPLAAIAAIYGLSKYMEYAHDKTIEQIDRIDTDISGTTQKAVEASFEKFSGGKSIETMIKEASEAEGKDRELILAQLDSILNAVTEETKTQVGNEATDPSSIPTTGANLGVDSKAVGDQIRTDEKMILTPWDYFKEKLFGEDENKLYSESLSTIDMSALGSIGQGGVTAADAAKNLSVDYQDISNVKFDSYSKSANDSNFMTEPMYKGFNYSKPLESIRDIAVEFCKITKGYHKSKNVTEARFDEVYNELFRAFTSPIGRNEEFMNAFTLWDSFKFNSFHQYTVGDSTIAKYALKVYAKIPNFMDLSEIYFSGVYSEDKSDWDNKHVSLMTIAQQYKMLGATLDPHSKLLNVTNKFYFLPVRINLKDRDTTIDEKTRVTLNSVGIAKAYKSYSSGDDGYLDQIYQDDLSIVTDNILAQATKDAFDEAAEGTDLSSMMTNLGTYASDTIVRGSINEYSGIEDEKIATQLAEKLEGHSYQELIDAYNGDNEELYDELLQFIPNNDKTSLNKVLNRVTNYQYKYSSHTDDIIESYSKMSKTNFTKDDFDKIIANISSNKELRDKYYKARDIEDKKSKLSEYNQIAQLMGFNYDDLPKGDKLINLVDRIFNNYRISGLNDEEGVDLDAAIHTYLGISGFTAEDLSSTVDLFGLGTADELVSKGFTPEAIVELLKIAKANDQLNSQGVVGENGSVDQVFSVAGNSIDSDRVKDALIKALTESGLLSSMASVLQGMDNISTGTATAIVEAAKVGANTNSDNSGNNSGDDGGNK